MYSILDVYTNLCLEDTVLLGNLNTWYILYLTGQFMLDFFPIYIFLIMQIMLDFFPIYIFLIMQIAQNTKSLHVPMPLLH